MTIKQAASELEVSLSTVYNWIEKGVLVASRKRYGTRYTYTVNDESVKELRAKFDSDEKITAP